PTARPPSVDPPIEPPGAGADAESDVAFGVIAHPARNGADASIRTRAVCEKRFTRVPPFREPWMGPRFGRGPRAERQVCTSNARTMPRAPPGEMWCNIPQIAAGRVRAPHRGGYRR